MRGQPRYCKMCGNQIRFGSNAGVICVSCQNRLPEEIQKKSKTIVKWMKLNAAIFVIIWVFCILELMELYDLGLSNGTMFIIMGISAGFGIVFGISLSIYQLSILKDPINSRNQL